MKKWIALNNAKEWIKADDAPWWYNERASLSRFAGGLWLTGADVLEEYSTSRTSKSIGGKAETKTGRCDLYFGIRNRRRFTGEASHHFIAEAKQIWPILGAAKYKTRSKIQKAVKKAGDEVRIIDDANGHFRLMIVFVAPRYRKNRKDASALLADFTEELSHIEGAAVAWIFPKDARTLELKEFYYPGVAIVVSLAKS